MRISDWSSDVCSSDLLHTSCYSGKSRLHTSRVRLANSVAHASQMESKTRKRAYRKEVGGRLKAARLDSKIGTQADVAAALSRAMGETIEPSAIGNYEQGRSEERRVGKEWVNTGRSRGSTTH